MQDRVHGEMGWWLLVTVGLLIAAAIVVPRLDYDALSDDELRSYIVSGGAHHGPLSWPLGVWERTAFESPDQALGFPIIIWLWGKLAGWSELGARYLAYLAGMLTIAIVYRIGRDLFYPLVGTSAALMISSSIFYSNFMHKFRVFTLASLSAAMVLWCYYRIALSGKRSGWFAMVGLIIGGIGLTYTHYFATPFIAVIGLYHLFFVPKTRRWWIPVGLLVPVLLVFTPALNVLIKGLSKNQNNLKLQARAMNPFEITLSAGTFLSNGFTWLLVGVLLLALWAVIRPLAKPDATRRYGIFIWWSSVIMLGMIITLNEIAGVFAPDRVRYLMALWVPVPVLIGIGIWQLNLWRRGAGWILLALWFSLGTWINVQDDLMDFDRGDEAFLMPWREMTDVVLTVGDPDDAYVYEGKYHPQHGHYTHNIPLRPVMRGYYDEALILEEVFHTDYKRFFWAIDLDSDLSHQLPIVEELMAERGYVECGVYLDHPRIYMTLQARSEVFCPVESNSPAMQFGDYLSVAQYDIIQSADRLQVQLGVNISPHMPLYTYSVGFHVVDANTGELVSQHDLGLEATDGPYAAIEGLIDLTDVSTGAYQLRLGVYNWQTGESLPASGTIGTVENNWIVFAPFTLE